MLRFFKFLATGAASASFLSPAIALADPPKASHPPLGPYTSAQVAALVSLAESQWSGNPCAGSVAVYPLTTAQAIAGGETDVADGFVHGSYAGTGSCDVFIVTDRHNGWIAAGVCSLLVHEIGHLGGLGHSDDPASIMAAVFENTVTCNAQADDAVHAVAPPAEQPDTSTGAEPSAWPPVRIVWARLDASGSLAMRLGKRDVADQLTIRFYRHGAGEFSRSHLLTTATAHVRRSFESGSPDVVVRAPRGWQWATLQLTGDGPRPGKVFTLRRGSLDNLAPAADEEFGVERGARPAPGLVGGGCVNPLRS
jgi:hypothetical protein